MSDVSAMLLEQTRTRIRENRRLLTASRYRIASARRSLNPWFALTGGSDGDGLRATIRARIATGALFPIHGTRAWASYGEDNPCIVCQEPITRAQVEYEVSSASTEVAVRAHLRCYMMWKEESQAPARPRRRTEGVVDIGPDPGASYQSVGIRFPIRLSTGDGEKGAPAASAAIAAAISSVLMIASVSSSWIARTGIDGSWASAGS